MNFEKNNKVDLDLVINDKNIDWEKLKDRSIFITGATGLIGKNIINSLTYANKKLYLNCKIYALVRNIDKANEIFKDIEDSNLHFVLGDVTKKIDCSEKIDYIIHGASQTSSKEFVNNSLETIDIALTGTKNVLDFAKSKNVKSFLFLSTMEVYGRPETDEKIGETHSTNLDTMETRNCYPISKRMCENLCVCYNVNAKIARLTQTFGPGVDYYDGRVFADFARCVIENRDIILHTKGETKREYLYTYDAVRALLIILLNGENSNAYNVANESTYCSIYDMATLVSKLSDNTKVVVQEENDLSKFGYAKTLKMNLDTTKVQIIGFKPLVDLKHMYINLIEYMKEKD